MRASDLATTAFMMINKKELTTDMSSTPIFYETLAAKAETTPEQAKVKYDDISDVTDLHRVETFIEWVERRNDGIPVAG